VCISFVRQFLRIFKKAMIRKVQLGAKLLCIHEGRVLASAASIDINDKSNVDACRGARRGDEQ
jgi:hypothetical protein